MTSYLKPAFCVCSAFETFFALLSGLIQGFKTGSQGRRTLMGSRTDYFDQRAADWERKCYPVPVRERLQRLIRSFGVMAGERLLDVGTGPGILIPYLRHLVGAAGPVCAFDLSFEMTRHAFAKPIEMRDAIVQADAHRIHFKDERFDRVICFAAFPHFTHPQGALQEMARVMKPGGTSVVAHLLSRRELAAHHAAHTSVARDVLPDVIGMIGSFSQAKLSLLEIVDRPGRYLTKGSKPEQ
jgi:SAM-dependent methyltransferase